MKSARLTALLVGSVHLNLVYSGNRELRADAFHPRGFVTGNSACIGEQNLVRFRPMTEAFDLNPTLPGVPDPYPIYRAVRETDPVHWCPGAGLWAITRYSDAESVLKDGRFSRQAFLDNLESRMGTQAILTMQRHELVFTDNPRHRDLRAVIGSAITAKSMQGLRPRVEEFIEQRLAPWRGKGSMDVIQDFARTYPTEVASLWLGIPEEDRPRMVEWIFPLVAGRGIARDEATTLAANQAVESFNQYFRHLIGRRRQEPCDDLVTSLVNASAAHPGLMDDDDLISLFIAVFAAGHGPGIALLANTLLALLRRPAELARLREHPDCIATAVEEGLRFDPPTQAPNPLAATVDVEIGGRTIRQGQVVSVIIGAANRDPDAFPDPDAFDITRHPNRHLAFSGGEHFCLGAVLARLEGQIALNALLRNFSTLKLGCRDADLRWIHRDRFRTLESLPVVFG